MGHEELSLKIGLGPLEADLPWGPLDSTLGWATLEPSPQWATKSDYAHNPRARNEPLLKHSGDDQ